MHVTLIILNSLVFIYYGLLCLLTDHMKQEFERYGLARFRTLTGWLELAGGLGVMVGLSSSPLLRLACAGLATLMFLGVGVRIKTKDAWYQALPAFVLFVLNLYLCLWSFGKF